MPRRKRRRVVAWTYYDWWRALLSCGHEVPHLGRGSDRRACRQCEEAPHA